MSRPPHNHPFVGCVALAAALAFFACDDSPAPPGGCDPSACEAGEVCGNEGQCVRSDCQDGTPGCRCTASSTCVGDSLCQAGECSSPCPDGQIRDRGVCRTAVGCEVCEIQARQCDDEFSESCGNCLDGFFEDDGDCTATSTCSVGVAGSIADDCEILSRRCIEGADGAECGECLSGTVEVGSTCEVELDCEELECEEQDRVCEAEPNARCTECLPDFVEEAGDCRPVLTCDGSPCASGRVCLEATANTDRVCAETDECPMWSVENLSGTCSPCAEPCDSLPESNGAMEPTAFAGTTCVCQAAEGNFLLPGGVGGAVGLVPCDDDGDGWVRDDILNLVDFAGDEILVRNNTCTVNTAMAVEFRDEYGQMVSTAALTEVIPLLESPRNDLQSTLDELSGLPSNARYLPPVGEGGRFLRAAELNGLAKYCVDLDADFNDNGVPDVQERHDDDTAPYVSLLQARSGVAVLLKDLTYFGELYTSFFEPNGDLCLWEENVGGSSNCGVLVIQERPRTKPEQDLASNAISPIAMTIYEDPSDEIDTNDDGSLGNNHWRSCYRFTDEEYFTRELEQPPRPNYGLDFAKYGMHAAEVSTLPEQMGVQPPVPALGHSSQFKCVVYDANAGPTDDFVYGLDELSSEHITLNTCAATENADGAPGALECRARSPGPVGNEFVGWGVTTFSEQSSASPYERGCVDEEVYFRAACPGWTPENDSVFTSEGDPVNYGKLLCGCDAFHGGPTCNTGCPAETRFMHPRYSDPEGGALYPISQREHWLCGDFALTSGSNFFTGDGYRLSGSIGFAGGELTGPGPGGEEWSLRGGFLLDYPSNN